MKQPKRPWAVVALSGIATIGSLTVSSPASAAAPLCQASQLRTTFVSGEGAAGHRYETWRMTNVGATCHTQGWVGALNFGPDGRPLPTTVTRVQGPAPALTLASGKSADWIFGYGNPAILGCRGEVASAMIVTPPDNVSPLLVHPGEPACNGAVTATPLRAQ